MFELNFNKANYKSPQTTLEEVKAKVTDIEIFKRYCPNFKELGKDFLSEFYEDSRPSCRIYRSSNGDIRYKDFGTGDNYNSFSYLMRKYYCSFPDTLNIIANDFKINKIDININPKIILKENNLLNNKDNYKTRIEIVSQPYNIIDYNYWNSYKIPLSLLEEYNVFSCSHIYLHKKDKTIVFEYRDNNPMYAYRFVNNGVYNYKIYKPLEENKRYKWLFSGRVDDIEGYDQLPWLGDLLIITKSLKDCMCYQLLGIPAISLQGEANKFDIELKNKLLKRFKTILVNYDNDIEGIRGSNRIMQETGFKYFYIDEPYKDLSDYMKEHTIEEAKIMISNKLSKIYEK